MRSRILFLLTTILMAVQALKLPTYSTCNPSVATVTAARGRITSPNFPSHYTKNLDCKWNVISPKGSGIRMTIEHLDNKEIFENGNGVCYDTLRIASVDSRGTPQYLHDEEELCAKSINKLTRKVFEIQNNGDGVAIAQISFQSDYVDQGTGFSIYFEALCNSTQSGESGTITSPNYPNKYPAYADCFTEIQAPHGSTIEIEFTNLQVETQNNCQTDYVDVIEGPPGLYGSKRTRYCKAVIGVLRISSYIATVEFVSDGTLAYSGFRATWKAVFSTTTTTTTSTTTTPTTTTTAAPSTTRTTTTLKTTTIEMKNCSYTNDSLLCQRWDSTKPHKPNYQPKDINHNYCRNPDNDARGYWCYTTDPDTRWGYCDIDNCVAPTTTTDETTTVTSEPTTISNEPTTITSEPTTITTSATTSDGGTSPLVAMFAGGSSAEKQASDGTITAAVLPWYAYIVIAAALVAFVIIVLIFVLRRRKKKKSALAINELNTTNTVVFSQYERDQYGDGARENTYVEIPFVGNMQESIALRDAADGGNDDTSGKGCFVRLPTNQTKNSSISSSDSIQLAKEAAQRRFSSDNRCEIASDANPYSLADEVAHNGQAPPLPEDRREHSLRGTTNVAMTEEANVYDVIDVSQLAGIKGNAFVRTSQPPPPSSERDTTKSKEDPEKKKPNEWKFLKKSTKSNLTSGAGFTNPSYQERDSSEDTVDEGVNPFDTDEEAVTDEPSTYHVPSANPPRGSQVNEEETNLYNVPSVIPIRPETDKVKEVSEKQKHASADSPYMLPKISMSNKVPAYNAMVPISPDLIDDGKKKAAFDNDLNLYSSPNPMSPTFEMVEDFTYDFPPDARSAASSFSSKNESEGGQGDFSGQDSRNARDSGNASMTAFDSIAAQDKNNEEYCSMGNFSPQEMRKKDGKGGAAKKPSHLYLSMKCIQPERRVSESSWQSTKNQTKNPRKSA